MDNIFTSYKYGERKDIEDTYTINDTITEGKQIEFTDYNMSLLRSLNTENGRIEYPYISVLEDYIDELKNLSIKYEMNDEQYRRYKYRPDLFSYDIYGKPDYEFVILLINGINTEKDFIRKTINYIDPDNIDVVLSFIRNASKEIFDKNRYSYKENKYF